MLLTDTDVTSLADMLAIDGTAAEVAALADPAIAIQGDGSAIREAWGEAKDALLAGLQAYGGGMFSLGPGSAAIQAISLGLANGAVRSLVFPEQIVVEDGIARSHSPLAKWLTYKALHLFYRNASERLGVDRYEEKSERYETAARSAWVRLTRAGIRVVRQPLSAPGALHDAKAGGTIFDSSALTTPFGGSSTSALSVDVAITWVNGNRYVSPSQPCNGESSPSERASITISAGTNLSVSIASLIAPDGLSPYNAFADGILSPLQATHWNVYVGPQGGGPSPLFLQNTTPIPVATQSWTGHPVLSGSRASSGQRPDIRLPLRNLFQRA